MAGPMMQTTRRGSTSRTWLTLCVLGIALCAPAARAALFEDD